mmetsp:Transcript_38087/g.82501  ORF Transcript_38087/g.82501 Transcript_38087/m.82501 type:complete len:319 (+) Transcript_38087:208-1164(+)
MVATQSHREDLTRSPEQRGTTTMQRDFSSHVATNVFLDERQSPVLNGVCVYTDDLVPNTYLTTSLRRGVGEHSFDLEVSLVGVISQNETNAPHLTPMRHHARWLHVRNLALNINRSINLYHPLDRNLHSFFNHLLHLSIHINGAIDEHFDFLFHLLLDNAFDRNLSLNKHLSVHRHLDVYGPLYDLLHFLLHNSFDWNLPCDRNLSVDVYDFFHRHLFDCLDRVRHLSVDVHRDLDFHRAVLRHSNLTVTVHRNLNLHLFLHRSVHIDGNGFFYHNRFLYLVRAVNIHHFLFLLCQEALSLTQLLLQLVVPRFRGKTL